MAMSSWLPHELVLRGRLRSVSDDGCRRFALVCAQRLQVTQSYEEDAALNLIRSELGHLWTVAEARSTYPARWSSERQSDVEDALGAIVRAEESGDPVKTHAAVVRAAVVYNGAVAAAHAGAAHLSDPVDNALWAARQLTDSLFAASIAIDRVPSDRRAWRSFAESDWFNTELALQTVDVEQAEVVDAPSLRRQANAPGRNLGDALFSMTTWE